MTKPIPALCNEGCNEEFNVSKFRTRMVKGGNEKICFTCPHCNQEYIAYYSNKETKTLQAQMRKLHREAYKSGSTMTALEIQIKEDNLKTKIKKSMDEAREVSKS